jgi:hypothetical protein
MLASNGAPALAMGAVVATQAPPTQVFPVLQSAGMAQVVWQTGAVWSTELAHAMALYEPQAWERPAQPVSSWTVIVPQTWLLQVASSRVPWQSVAGPGTVQAGAAWKLAGQSVGARQQLPPVQQSPLSQWLEAHPSFDVQAWPLSARVSSLGLDPQLTPDTPMTRTSATPDAKTSTFRQIAPMIPSRMYAAQ